MMTEHQSGQPEHDVLFKLYVRRHHVGQMSKTKARRLLHKLKKRIAVSSGGAWHIEMAEVHSVRETRRGAA